TRKQTSVKGSERNSSSSSGERFAISAGMYNPPSGAIPRKTAPRKEVSGALFDVLRYLTPHHRVCLGPVPKTLSARATLRATLSLQSCSGRALHSFAAAQQLSSDSTELRSPVAFRLAAPETLPAKAPASDRSNNVQSITAAPAARL